MDKYQRVKKIKKSVSWIPVINNIVAGICDMILDKSEDAVLIANDYKDVQGITLMDAGYYKGNLWVGHPDGTHMSFFFTAYDKPTIGERIRGQYFLGYLCYDGTISVKPKDYDAIWYAVWLKEQADTTNEETKD